MSYSKSYLAKMRGKKVRFIIVNSGADLKVQFVSIPREIAHLSRSN